MTRRPNPCWHPMVREMERKPQPGNTGRGFARTAGIRHPALNWASTKHGINIEGQPGDARGIGWRRR